MTLPRPTALACSAFEQAEAKARVMVGTPNGKLERLTVRQAFDRYIAYKRALGQ